MKKTNVMRLLDSKKIDYKSYSYQVDDKALDGLTVARAIGQEASRVYKTLLTRGERDYYVFILPVGKELDLKKAASLSLEKKIELVNPKDLLKLTGYIRGGCSPLGMKKSYPSFVDESALEFESIIFSAGKIGYQVQVDPRELEKFIDVKFKDITS